MRKRAGRSGWAIGAAVGGTALALSAAAMVGVSSASMESAADPAATVSATADPGADQIVCPDVASELTAVPARAQNEVARNVALLELQIAEAQRRLESSAGQGGDNFVQNAILGPLASKRQAAIQRIEIAIGRAGDRPKLDEQALGTCQATPPEAAATDDPAADASATADPAATDPSAADPAATDPAADPSATDPATESAAADESAADPAAESAAADESAADGAASDGAAADDAAAGDNAAADHAAAEDNPAADEGAAADESAAADDAAADAGLVECPDIAKYVSAADVPEQAQDVVDENLKALADKEAAAEQKIAAAGHRSAKYLQENVLGPLAVQRVAIIVRIGLAIDKYDDDAAVDDAADAAEPNAPAATESADPAATEPADPAADAAAGDPAATDPAGDPAAHAGAAADDPAAAADDSAAADPTATDDPAADSAAGHKAAGDTTAGDTAAADAADGDAADESAAADEGAAADESAAADAGQDGVDQKNAEKRLRRALKIVVSVSVCSLA